MTDNEIIKALECCMKICEDCENCPCINNNDYTSVWDCKDAQSKSILDLIKRQKAEIERLQTENKLLTDNHPANTHSNCVAVDNGLIFTKTLADYDKLIGDIANEAIKEFAKYLLDNYASGGVISAVDVVGAVVDWGTSSG